MANVLVGSWDLKVWRRIAQDDSVSFPLGENARGLLVYTSDGHMAVQMAGAARPTIDTNDPLNGGTADQRAAAYATCLAYFGRYEVKDGNVVHRVAASLFPNWSDVEQVRPFTLNAGTLTLRTPKMHLPSGDVINEMIWTRAEPHHDTG